MARRARRMSGLEEAYSRASMRSGMGSSWSNTNRRSQYHTVLVGMSTLSTIANSWMRRHAVVGSTPPPDVEQGQFRGC